MTYRIHGLSPDSFAPLFALSEADLAARGAIRVTAASSRGYPCRIRLEDAPEGEELILLNFTSHDVATPFRSAYAIYVSDTPTPATFNDSLPPMLERRTLGLRGFDSEGMLVDARLAMPGEADRQVRELFADGAIASIHAHNAAHGCFLARIERN